MALGLGYLELPQGSLAVLFWSFYLFSSQLFIDLIFYVLYSGYPWWKVDDEDAGNQKCLYPRLSFRDLCLVRENLVKNPVPWFFFLSFFFFHAHLIPQRFREIFLCSIEQLEKRCEKLKICSVFLVKKLFWSMLNLHHLILNGGIIIHLIRKETLSSNFG